MRKNKKLIPKGSYCYSFKKGKRVICPYWSTRPVPNQISGYCAYLGKGDIELNNEYEKKSRWTDGKTGRFVKSPKGLPLSLLWDMVKECRIKEK